MTRFILLVLSFGLMISGCGKDDNSQNPNENTPFDDNNPTAGDSQDFIDRALGNWFSQECEALSDTTSTLNTMKFSFNRPFSWKDDFFAEDSIEFTGDLEIEKVIYDNAFCLGMGDKNQVWPEKTRVFRNISVLKDTIQQNEFYALYMDTSKTKIGEPDEGSGYYLKFSQKNQGVEVTAISRFSYIGKAYTLSPLQDNSLIKTLDFSSQQSPLKSKNKEQIKSPLIRAMINQSECGYYSIYEHFYATPGGQTAYGIFNAQNGLISFASGLVYNYGGTSQFQSSNLDWLAVGDKVYTDRNFILSEDQGMILLQNPTLDLETFISSPKKMEFDEISEFLKDYATSPYAIFSDCSSL